MLTNIISHGGIFKDFPLILAYFDTKFPCCAEKLLQCSLEASNLDYSSLCTHSFHCFYNSS